MIPQDSHALLGEMQTTIATVKTPWNLKTLEVQLLRDFPLDTDPKVCIQRKRCHTLCSSQLWLHMGAAKQPSTDE